MTFDLTMWRLRVPGFGRVGLSNRACASVAPCIEETMWSRAQARLDAEEARQRVEAARRELERAVQALELKGWVQ